MKEIEHQGRRNREITGTTYHQNTHFFLMHVAP
jgi:hypothetical protein